MTTRPYHHGSLRQALLRAAAEAIAEKGVAALSLRELARRAGVSHAASSHHFGDKAGLLTALAAEGHDLLGDELAAAMEETGDFLEVGVAYVRFAIRHRSHFEVMFRPDLVRNDDPVLMAARARTSEALYGGVATVLDGSEGTDPGVAGIAAWSIVHGFASLWLNGALNDAVAADPEAAARSVAGLLFRR